MVCFPAASFGTAIISSPHGHGLHTLVQEVTKHHQAVCCKVHEEGDIPARSFLSSCTTIWYRAYDPGCTGMQAAITRRRAMSSSTSCAASLSSCSACRTAALMRLVRQPGLVAPICLHNLGPTAGVAVQQPEPSPCNAVSGHLPPPRLERLCTDTCQPLARHLPIIPLHKRLPPKSRPPCTLAALRMCLTLTCAPSMQIVYSGPSKTRGTAS